MSQHVNLTGRVFAKPERTTPSLTVLRFAGTWVENGVSKRHWLCRCTCGNTRVVNTANLRSGAVHQCGACAARSISERRRASAARRAERMREAKPARTTEQRRKLALDAQARMTGNGQKYLKDYKAYRAQFNEAQWNVYQALLRGRKGPQIEAEAVDLVMRYGSAAL
jgi:hypothetical protein